MTHELQPNDRKKVNLALQGGGSHGAFTWGVLDFLLEDGRLEIDAISGTSAGAMNAVALAEGHLEGGREGARKKLAEFWNSVSSESALSPIQRTFFDFFFGYRTPASEFAYWGADWLTHYASPYDLNPLAINPLLAHLKASIDFAKVRAHDDIKLFIAATNVHTGKVKIFKQSELTAEHVMASACLPYVFQAMVIDGVPYWDGGYMGNPPLFPLYYASDVPDIVIVQINPIERDTTPRTAREIQNRLNEITFNGALLSELRAIDFVNRLVDSGKLPTDRYMRPFVHRIDGGEALNELPASTKTDTTWSLIESLFNQGRVAGKQWLDAQFESIGKETTLNLRMAFADLPADTTKRAVVPTAAESSVPEDAAEP